MKWNCVCAGGILNAHVLWHVFNQPAAKKCLKNFVFACVFNRKNFTLALSLMFVPFRFIQKSNNGRRRQQNAFKWKILECRIKHHQAYSQRKNGSGAQQWIPKLFTIILYANVVECSMCVWDIRYQSENTAQFIAQNNKSTNGNRELCGMGWGVCVRVYVWVCVQIYSVCTLPLWRGCLHKFQFYSFSVVLSCLNFPTHSHSKLAEMPLL